MNDAPMPKGARFPPDAKAVEDLDLILRSFCLEGERIVRLSTGKEAKGTRNAGGYLVVSAGSRRDGSMRQLRLHRVKFALFFGWLPEFIDHIDGNRLNNAIANLRPCSKSDNMANSSYSWKPMPKSGFRNVESLPHGKFSARVSQGGKQRNLGTFDTAQEAKEAVELFKQKHRGDFYTAYHKRPKAPSRINSINGTENAKRRTRKGRKR